MADEKDIVPPRRDRSRRHSPVPAQPHAPAEWGKLVVIVVSAALGGGGTGGYAAHSLLSYRVEQLEHRQTRHIESPSHHEAQRAMDVMALTVERVERDLEEEQRQTRERYLDISNKLDALQESVGRRRR